MLERGCENLCCFLFFEDLCQFVGWCCIYIIPVRIIWSFTYNRRNKEYLINQVLLLAPKNKRAIAS